MAARGFIAGWEDRFGEWHNVEAGDREPSQSELAESDRIVVGAYEQEGGEPRYLTTSFLTPDFDLDDFLDESAEDYGVEFV